jgi:hypothetical protein
VGFISPRCAAKVVKPLAPEPVGSSWLLFQLTVVGGSRGPLRATNDATQELTHWSAGTHEGHLVEKRDYGNVFITDKSHFDQVPIRRPAGGPTEEIPRPGVDAAGGLSTCAALAGNPDPIPARQRCTTWQMPSTHPTGSSPKQSMLCISFMRFTSFLAPSNRLDGGGLLFHMTTTHRWSEAHEIDDCGDEPGHIPPSAPLNFFSVSRAMGTSTFSANNPNASMEKWATIAGHVLARHPARSPSTVPTATVCRTPAMP